MNLATANVQRRVDDLECRVDLLLICHIQLDDVKPFGGFRFQILSSGTIRMEASGVNFKAQRIQTQSQRKTKTGIAAFSPNKSQLNQISST